MFDVWIGDRNLTVLAINIAIAIFLPLQLLLCFKVKSLGIRMSPIILLGVLAVAAIVMYCFNAGWSGLIYIFGVIYIGLAMLMCGIGWGIWAIVKVMRNAFSK